MNQTNNPNATADPVLEYGEGRSTQAGFLGWISGAPSRSMNAFATATALLCIWEDTNILESPSRAAVAAVVWAVIGIAWTTKVLIAAEDPAPGEGPKQRFAPLRWAVIPAVLILVAAAYAGNLPLRATFWINHPGLQRLAAGPRPPSRSPVGQTLSHAIQSIETDGPRVSLLVGGINGVEERKFGFQHVTDGTAPRYPNVKHYLSMGGGWYAFWEDRPVI